MTKQQRFLICMASAAIVFLGLAGCVRGTPIPDTAAPDQAETRCASKTWTVVGKGDFGQTTLSTMFGDASFGITTDLNGGIRYTEDGGGTWYLAATAGSSRVALEMVGESTIWHIGYGGWVSLSVDRGHSWEQIGPLPHNAHVEYVSFADEKSGWAVTSEMTVFYATGDGAKTWSKIPFPQGMGFPSALHLLTPRDGYMLDTDGDLFVTADGGETWERQSIGLKDGWKIPTLNHSAAMRFLDRNLGVVALTAVGEGQGRVYSLRTRDGGRTWTEESLALPMGMFHLTRDGVFLTHVSMLEESKFTILCSTEMTASE